MTTKLKRLQYSRDDRNAAPQPMENRMTIHVASKKFKNPKTTLLYKQQNAYIDHPTILSTLEENKIKQ